MRLGGAVSGFLRRAVAAHGATAGAPAAHKDFSNKKRKKLGGTGTATPDGSYPIENEQDPKNATHAIDRAKDPAAVKRHVPTEREKTRKCLSLLITFLVIGLFACVGFRYLRCDDAADRADFVHLIEMLLVVYGTVLGFYFGSAD